MRTLALSFLLGCSGPTPPAPVDTPDVAVIPQAPAMPGLLTEAEFKQAHTLTDRSAGALRGAQISLSDDTSAYLALPQGAEGPVPAVLIVHEWWGLNDHMRRWADRLADDGYATLAVDLYGGKVATTRDEAMALMKGVDQAQALKTISVAHRYLQHDPRIMAPRTGVVGWCFGGSWSLKAAMHEAELDAAVIYYGRLQTEPQALATIQAPVLGHFGARDEGIPRESVQAFHDAMKQAGKPITVHMYDADHAFANPSGAHYDEPNAEKAWTATQAFLSAHVKNKL